MGALNVLTAIVAVEPCLLSVAKVMPVGGKIQLNVTGHKSKTQNERKP